MLVQRAKSGDLHVSQHATWGMSVYIVEDLRWQPAHYERPGWPRTAELFAGYLQTGAFDHPDPAMQAALARLAPDIAGCFLFPVRFIPGRRPQVLVLHKRDSADAAGGP
jgi:hypothetical protein